MLNKSRKYAYHCHNSTNHTYDGHSYTFHLNMVDDVAVRFLHLIPEDKHQIVRSACYCHDTIEDCRQTYNDVKLATSIEVAEIVYALTNEKGKTRKERANAQYYAGIKENELATFVKLCDRIANTEHSINTGSRMLKMYSKENPAFMEAIKNPKFQEMFNYLEKLYV